MQGVSGEAEKMSAELTKITRQVSASVDLKKAKTEGMFLESRDIPSVFCVLIQKSLFESAEEGNGLIETIIETIIKTISKIIMKIIMEIRIETIEVLKILR